MTEEKDPKAEFLEMLVAILIAIATVVGGVVAWRGSVAEDGAGDADFAGLKASLNVVETRALNFVNAYENYGSYVTYTRNNRLGDLIAEDQDTVTEDEADVLEAQRADAHDLATANQNLFPNKFLNRDGSYALQRQMGTLWADAAREKDLNPDPQYAEADQGRGKMLRLLMALLVLTIAPVFYSLVESVGDRAKVPMIVAGTLFLVAGIVLTLLVEFQKV